MGNNDIRGKNETNKYQPMIGGFRLVYPDYYMKQVHLVMDVLGGYETKPEKNLENLINPTCVKCLLFRIQKSVIAITVHISHWFNLAEQCLIANMDAVLTLFVLYNVHFNSWYGFI